MASRIYGSAARNISRRHKAFWLDSVLFRQIVSVMVHCQREELPKDDKTVASMGGGTGGRALT
ncbi:MAG TPA: hypothetical protein VNU69_05135, partial [Rhizomicrobium sp.]|nr:hypothetical protein [Rhizomicrobium sp.]